MDWIAHIRTALSDAGAVPDDEVVEELAQHARALYEAARADGCSHAEAAGRVAGQVARWRDEVGVLRRRPRRRTVVAPPAESRSPFSGLQQDVAYSVRLLLREPRPAVLTILTLALGIAAATVVFSVAYGVLMKPLPWPAADRIVTLRETRGGAPPRFGTFSNAAYLAWQDKADTIDGLAAWSLRRVTLTRRGDPEPMQIVSATSSLFPLLGVRPLLGGFFGPDDETSPVVVLSESLWRGRFGADPGVIGTPAYFDDSPYTIVAVLPDGMSFPDAHARAIVPWAVRPATGNSLSMFDALARLRPGRSAGQAAAEGTARGRFARETGMTTSAIFGTDGPIDVTARSLQDELTGDVRRPLILLLAAAGLLLAAAIGNVASLQLARATARRREMAIRTALGAGPVRLVRQLLVEHLLLGLSGGAVGLGLAVALHASLPVWLPPDFPRLADVRVDPALLAFALLISTGASILVGAGPALRARRLDPAEALAADGAAVAAGGAFGSGISRTRTLIMVGQVAIACVLLVVASLLARSFLALLSADRGYEVSDVLSARLTMSPTMYPAPERRFEIVDQVLGRLSSEPSVSEAAFTSELPLTRGGSTSAFTLALPGRAPVTAQASPRIVSPRYFAALRIHAVAGRVFSDADTSSTPPVVVVNQAFASRYLGDGPIGTKLPRAGYGRPDGAPVEATVIGVVADVRYDLTSADGSQPEMYYSYLQMGGALPVQTVTLLARASTGSPVPAAALVAAVRDADDRLAADVVVPLEQRLVTMLARPRLYAALLVVFGTSALALAGVGLFGLLSYSVSQRARELAIRSALGARRIDVVRLVVGQGMAATAVGLGAGLLLSVWLAELVSAQLYGVAPRDLPTLVGVSTLVLGVATVACLVPASHAAGVDPVRVLRDG